MKKYPHIFCLFFCLLLATTMNAQFMTPPDQVDEFGLEQYLNNGAMNLKDLNPAHFINNKQRRFLEQEWMQNAWQNLSQEQKQFAANCGLPLQRTYQDYDMLSNTFKTTNLDSFIYANNRLRTWNSYRVSNNGVRTLSEVAQFAYTTRVAPDTVLWVSIFGQFSDTTRFIYTFNASEQLTTIREDGKDNNTFSPLSRAQLTYDARGNLTRYLVERPDGASANWLIAQDNRYTYNASNQLTEKVNLYVITPTNIDTIKQLQSYDAQNRLIKLSSIYDGDTSVITVSNHNTKKRPRLLEFVESNTSSPFFGKATITYQSNDSLVANMITQGKTRVNDPFVNESRFIFEYCGDAVATKEVKKELLNCQVFPNPASESLTIRLKEETISAVDVSIVNTTGQVVFQARNRAIDTPLSIATLPNGLYILKVQSADKLGITSFTVLK